MFDANKIIQLAELLDKNDTFDGFVMDDQTKSLIEKTKSTSGISGPELAMAHMMLGRKIGRIIKYDMPDITKENTIVVAILRGGMFFAEGIYFELGCQFEVLDPKEDDIKLPDAKNVILVDSVINTGKTIKEMLRPGVITACVVINEKAVSDFADSLYAVRVSKNSYVGEAVKKQEGNKGPDTTMRLFNQI